MAQIKADIADEAGNMLWRDVAVYLEFGARAGDFTLPGHPFPSAQARYLLLLADGRQAEVMTTGVEPQLSSTKVTFQVSGDIARTGK